MNEGGQVSVSRRELVGASVCTLAGLAGCLGSSSGADGTDEHEFDLTVTQSDGELGVTVEPERNTPGVVTVGVGDSVTFTIINDANIAVGLHDHATDRELVLEPDASQTLQFTPTDSMVGRHEIEGYRATGDGDHDHEHGHGDDDHGDDDHGDDHDHGHDDSIEEETAAGDDTAASDDAGGHGGETVTLLTVEIRP
jgi:hypothetical protein